MLDQMMEVKKDETLNCVVVKTLGFQGSGKEEPFMVAFKDEVQAKTYLASLSLKEIPSPIENQSRYTLVGNHPLDSSSQIYIFKG